MAFGVAAGAAGTAASDTVTVSGAGFTPGDWVTLLVKLDGNGSTFSSHPGFTLVTTINEALANIGEPQQLSVFQGPYVSGNFTINIAGAGGTTPSMIALSNSGRTNVVSTVFQSTIANGGTSPRNIPLAGVTTTALDDVLWIGCIAAGSTGGTWVTSAPATYTSRQEVSDTIGLNYSGTICVCTLDASVGGATGTLTGQSVNAGHSGDIYGLIMTIPASGGGGAPALLGQICL